MIMSLAPFRRDSKNAPTLEIPGAFHPACMHRDAGKLVIIKSCAEQLPVFQRESQRADEMQPGTRISA